VTDYKFQTIRLNQLIQLDQQKTAASIKPI
jgi:hypothetical protein